MGRKPIRKAVERFFGVLGLQLAGRPAKRLTSPSERGRVWASFRQAASASALSKAIEEIESASTSSRQLVGAEQHLGGGEVRQVATRPRAAATLRFSLKCS
jgi:hypothetical protein